MSDLVSLAVELEEIILQAPSFEVAKEKGFKFVNYYDYSYPLKVRLSVLLERYDEIKKEN